MGFLKRFKSTGRQVPKTSPLQHIHDMMAHRELKIEYTAPSVKPVDYGNSPSATLEINFDIHTPCPGFDASGGTIELKYNIASGTQESYHPNPGVRFDGTRRKAFLPNTPQGRCLLTRFKYAFETGNMFQVGRSITSKRDNQTTWTSIPNKTSLQGGEFGFPDKDYLATAHGALDQAGIPDADDCLTGVNSGPPTINGFASRQQQTQQQPLQAKQTAAAPDNYSYPVRKRTIQYNAPASLSLSEREIDDALEPYVDANSSGLPAPIPAPIAPAAADKPSPYAPIPAPIPTPPQWPATLVPSFSAMHPAVAPSAPMHNNNNPPPASAPSYTPPPATAPPSPSHIRATFANLQPASLITASQVLKPGDLHTNSTRSAHGPDCAICLDVLKQGDSSCTQLKLCKHGFHRKCIVDCLKASPNCPVCRRAIGNPQGKCPSGKMTIDIDTKRKCPGFAGSDGSLSILYEIPTGLQASYHENPGVSYDATTRVAYLPNNQQGRQLLYRLVYAWKRGLTFRVGTSLTSHKPNQVTWTSIHHKTSLHGGPHGFPDVNYLDNCHKSLDALNVPDAQGCILKRFD